MNGEAKSTDALARMGFGVTLRVGLLLAVFLSFGAWIVQWLAAYPVPSIGSSATAGALALGLLLSVATTPFAFDRLICFPSSRTIGSYLLTSICSLLLVLALSLGITLVAGVRVQMFDADFLMALPPNKALQTDKGKLSRLSHSQKPRLLAFAAELGR